MTPGLPSQHDLYLFHEGNLFHSYRMLGSHITEEDGVQGVRFSVWAPNAEAVAVAGDFNAWNGELYCMERLEDTGIWSLFVPELQEGAVYKYAITSRSGTIRLKADPYAVHAELRPRTASIVRMLKKFTWNDGKWQRSKRRKSVYRQPMNIYEVHLGSWKNRGPELFYTYQEYAADLVQYVLEMGYTHIELLPLAEHPYDRSWGYQATGYYSATSRYGTPEQLMSLIDLCHQHDIGVIMDWVPGHFCKDNHGLRLFDGSPLYEHEDARISEKSSWGTLAFDFSKPEVVSFLISNAIFWMDVYHVDGMRVDAVASMMNLNFDKSPHEDHIRNRYGGSENLDALAFLKKLNQVVFQYFPEAVMIAEDSSDWPLVTAPVHVGGLGFNFKWNMGWMNDMLRYMQKETFYRKYHHNLITFSLMYAYSENFILPFSHDEVVHGKRSLLHKMPGDYWQKFANLRLLYGYMLAHPGKKLLFMGSEFGQFDEWKDMEDLDWELLGYEKHSEMHQYVKTLNILYKKETPLWELDHNPEGFSWIDADNAEQSIISFIRKSAKDNEQLVVVCNFTTSVYHNYRIGVPDPGFYREILNSDAQAFGGSNQLNKPRIKAKPIPWHNLPYSINITVPPLGAVWFKHRKILERGANTCSLKNV